MWNPTPTPLGAAVSSSHGLWRFQARFLKSLLLRSRSIFTLALAKSGLFSEALSFFTVLQTPRPPDHMTLSRTGLPYSLVKPSAGIVSPGTQRTHLLDPSS